jgi:phthalate 4,5-dioxygenase reductase component
MNLQVARAATIAREVRLLELRDPSGAELPAFTAGAHVRVTAPNGMGRQYSLCNDPADRARYEIAVKRDGAGHGGSVSMAEDVRVGALLEVDPPRNAFELAPGAASFLFIAGGIGITPIVSMIRQLAREGTRRYRLHYCTRSPEDTAFREELSAEPFSASVAIHHDGGDPARALDLWPLLEKPTRAHVYCCGPRPLLESVRDMTGHWPASAVHFESFVDAAAAQRPEDRAFTVVLARSGARIQVPPGRSILEAMRANGHDAPSSCESGTCGTCRTALLSGEPDHRDMVLTEEERATRIMICVSRARSAEIAIDR